jgi:hypothetical protein
VETRCRRRRLPYKQHCAGEKQGVGHIVDALQQRGLGRGEEYGHIKEQNATGEGEVSESDCPDYPVMRVAAPNTARGTAKKIGPRTIAFSSPLASEKDFLAANRPIARVIRPENHGQRIKRDNKGTPRLGIYGLSYCTKQQ